MITFLRGCREFRICTNALGYSVHENALFYEDSLHYFNLSAWYYWTVSERRPTVSNIDDNLAAFVYSVYTEVHSHFFVKRGVYVR